MDNAVRKCAVDLMNLSELENCSFVPGGGEIRDVHLKVILETVD